ncbi:MAG: hypothetical protein IPP94_01795 [Ignavibacteria bacterium]|nr:hypothetical protein [Ignavibacteria bacterium]
MKRTHFFLVAFAVSFFFAIPHGIAQELRGVMLGLTVSNFNNRSQNLSIGIIEGASKGIDQQLGELELPPFPPQEIFDARIASTPGMSSLGTGSLSDYRPASPSTTSYTETYTVAYQGGLGATKVKLEWQFPLPGRVTKLTVDGTDVTALASIDIPFPGGQATVVVTYNYAPLSFTALPTSLSFDANNRDALPSKPLEIIPQGDSQAQWMISSDADWLSLDAGSGEGRQTITVEVRTGIIPTGVYTGIITVRSLFDPAFLDIPVTLNYTLGANGAPLPEGMALTQNFPNPASGSTAISVSLGVQAAVSSPPILKVTDMAGRVVLDLSSRLRRDPGPQTLAVDIAFLPAGSYTYTLSGAGYEVSRSMIVVK